MEPLVPMEPVRVDIIPTGSDWVSQVKWDGVRVLTYAMAGHVELYNRRRRRRTLHYPELVDCKRYCDADAVILDGEVVALGANGTPDFHQVMKRDAIRRFERVPVVQRAVPIHYMVFDILYYNGQWLTDRPFGDRFALLERVIRPSDVVQVVTTTNDGPALYQAMETFDMEGIVAKRVDSTYRIGEKVDTWRKIKRYRDLVAVIGGYTLGDNGVINALLLGMYDEAGALHYIGHVGTGRLTQEEWRSLTTRLQALAAQNRPFAEPPSRSRSGSAPVHWVLPVVTVKVHYAEWTRGRSLRQPSVQSITNIPPTACILRADLMRP
ncbi:bifunctional non-homologous end joining protein LigD [Alicyclobacillus cycloheptanicus]|uniref:DNA ligase (ATP) n=1 Tax=Alicyclobacillus cycloheptanicus TaxID=1457 RepID=A0ABT9XE57_9BACL|nr:bifunctional non-homologous end joining protein LigD [Alicyclobacillus cycloheptanicus]